MGLSELKINNDLLNRLKEITNYLMMTGTYKKSPTKRLGFS
jgi:hypothetical protein